MKFSLLMYTVPADARAMTPSEIQAVQRKHEALVEELTHKGVLLNGAGMVPPDQTVLLRLGADGIETHGGPLSAAPGEHLSAYYVVECDLDEAREIAGRLLDDHVTAVETREIHDFVGM